MPQIELFVLLLAVAAGLVGLHLLGRQGERCKHEFLRSLQHVVVSFNLLVLFALFFRYVQMHLLAGASHDWVDWLLWASLTGLTVLKLVFLFYLVEMNAAFFGRTLSTRLRRNYLWISAVLMVLLILAGTLEGIGLVSLAETGFWLFENIFLLAALLVTLVQLRNSLELTGIEFRKAGLSLGGIHLAVFGSALLVFLTGILEPAYMGLVGSLSVLFYNLLVVIWSQRFVPAVFADELVSKTGEDLLNAFGITPREREVIDLICQGRTNQEIADSLFISLQTVKDHNYSIFRKMRVRNRVELAQRFSR